VCMCVYVCVCICVCVCVGFSNTIGICMVEVYVNL